MQKHGRKPSESKDDSNIGVAREAWRQRLNDQDWERMVTSATSADTNPVESPFSALRLRTDAARRLWPTHGLSMLVRFRRLKAPHLMRCLNMSMEFQSTQSPRESRLMSIYTLRRNLEPRSGIGC